MNIEIVTDAIAFHVTNPASGRHLKAGDKITCGVEENPFFHFYDTEAARRRMTIASTDPEWPEAAGFGATDPWKIGPIAYLRVAAKTEERGVVRRGAMRYARDIADHFAMLSRELIWEEIRAMEFADAPSRQTCLFCSKEINPYWNRPKSHVAQTLELRLDGTLLTVDSRMLMRGDETISEMRELARRYWRGEQSDSPQTECLFKGDAIVVGIV